MKESEVRMNYLFIEAIDPKSFRVGILGLKKQTIRVVEKRSHAILAEVIKITAKKKIDGVCVVSGPGSFTTVRTGVLIANVYARFMHIPLYSVDATRAMDLLETYAAIRAGTIVLSSFVAPRYSSEPNITLKTS